MTSTMTPRTFRVLLVEDSTTDALLLTELLRDFGFDPLTERVETADAMQNALDREEWDIVISDYSMPRFSGPDALAIMKRFSPETPFIVVSGTIGEEVAVEMMRSGARDYLLKENLGRLGAAVDREIGEAKERKLKWQTERAYEEAQKRFRATFEQAAVGMAHLGLDGKFLRVNRRYCEMLGYSAAELQGKTFRDITHPDDVADDEAAIQSLLTGQAPLYRREKRYARKDGS
ncbi:MAG TPA: PAS domain S-box protein, partial [Thermoanaerobaculia bacterium]